KGGVAAMTLPAARELARSGIRVMTIAPGLFETAMSAGLSPDARTVLEAGLPFPSRMGRPDEFAMLVQQIVENQLLNGEVIRIDSAVRLAPK
ncbi:MAG: SDR family oxidoreductase, partial [Paracoccus denitrificans]